MKHFILPVVVLLAVQAGAATDTVDPYDQLYDVLMTRHAKDGKAYATNETSPSIFFNSKFPFDDKTYPKLNKALDAFGALSQTDINAYSNIKRALMQRHLWKIFDTTHPYTWRSHKDRRLAVQPRIASLMRRLALTRKEILALPNTLEATKKSGGIAEDYDPNDLFRPFLPRDLYSQESSWTSVGSLIRPLPADFHSTKFKWRSAFLSFMRVSEDHIETIKSIEKFNRREFPPLGTQFALIEQAFLISDDRELILSPLIVSVSLRVHVGQSKNARTGRPITTQSLAEFLMQPRQLMQGNAAMKALAPQDQRFEAGDAGSIVGGEEDPFEYPGAFYQRARLQLCRSCHGGATKRAGFITGLPHLGHSRYLKTDSPETIIKATAAIKRHDNTWKSLQQHWQTDSE